MKYKLKDIFDLQMGKTPSRNNSEYWNSEDYKWISIADLSKTGKYISDTKEYLSESAVEESGIKVIPANTVVMSFKLSIGKTAITAEDMYSNEAIMAFHDKHVVDVLPEYIFYMFKYRNWDEGSNKAVMGKTLNKATLSEVEIEICPIEEQREIVNILDKMMSILNGRENELSLLDDLIKARFVELFGNPVLNDKGWEQKSLGEISSKIGSGATPRGGKEAYQEDGITLIRSMNVYNGQFEYKDLAHISDEQAEKLDNVTIEENDVLLNITGASVARSCVVPSEILPARVNQHVCIIRCKDCIIPEFLNKLLIDDNYQYLLWSIAGSGATREAITKQQVENLQIILPPLELQNRFADFVHQVDKSKVAVQKALDETQLLFDSLMQEYFG
ncbi:MAG: restriction endonuclease subunit S [Lachnospiraceae bacterium]|nr:restriction endonuclease subunit S [Lachnospiraceae bacterium]